MSSIIMQFKIPRDTNEIQNGRRSGGYKPTHWDFNSIQSFEFEHMQEKHVEKVETLIEKVKKLLLQEQRLELIDDLRRLGISCHFRHEIDQILNSKYLDKNETDERDLYSTALRFILLRQYGFNVSQEVFDCFKNDKATDFDTKGLLQLYEASFLATHGEETLEMAKQFATKSLKKRVVNHEIEDIHLLSSVEAALEFPSHWMVQMPNAKAFVDAYKKRPDMNPIVLELAILDLRIVQAQFLGELKESSRLADDMGTSLDEGKRGDVPKAVQCYMYENHASEQDARKHVRSLIEQTWKMMNKEMMDSPFSTCYVEVCANLARMAQLIYQKESDGFGMQHSVVNKQLRSLLFEPYE
ncbi:hypothetical protein SASPL_134347 [Salvia splendens]|uniref:Uncharacterized protein n=1 Tax=Salvia splendens TaxID=180675 RepID=A0A8X8ZJC5_SALSN|nr:hypothetical protein SASPL_134347 [Salvia splendens]